MAKVGLRACVPAILVLALSACGGSSDSSSGTAQANESIAINATPATTASVGAAYQSQVVASAPAGAVIGYSIQRKPAWVTFNTKTGSLQGTPTASDVGNYPNVVVTASDGSGSASTPPFTITVTQPSSASSGATSSSTTSSSTTGSGTTASTTTNSATNSGTSSSGTTSSSASSASTSTSTSSTTTSSSSTVSRPSYNTGNGFFVLNGKLYDANGNEFRIRGVNRVHWDSDSAAGMALSKANTVRTFIDFTQNPSNNVNLIQTQNINYSEVPIVTYAGTGSGETATSCSSDSSVLQAAVQAWTSQASDWTTLNKYLIVNVANEWGPADSSSWQSSNTAAIASLRQAGYTGPILIDTGGCGQDESDLAQYAQTVFQSDPERNIIFTEHLYGSVNDYSATIQSVQRGNPTVITLNSSSATHPFVPGYTGSGNTYSGISAYEISGVQGMTQLNGEQPAPTNIGGTPGAWTVTLNVDSTNWPNYTGGGTIVDYNGNYALRIARMAAMAQSTGAVFLIGEFGPGNDIGPSPTMVTPGEIIQAAEANGLGWLPWAWDDNDLAGGASDNNWFSMTYAGPGIYNSASDLTNYGQDVVLNSTYGISTLAKPASIFSSL